MKVLLVSNSAWNLFNFRIGFMNTLKAKGIDVCFCSPRDTSSDKLIRHGFKFIPISIDRKGRNFFKDFMLIGKLSNIYKREKPDIIFHYTIKPNIYGSFAAKISGKKCLNTVSGLGFVFIRKPFYYPLVKMLYTLSCSIAKKTFFHNADDLNFFVANKIISSEKAVCVNGSGVNTRFFSPDTSNIQYNRVNDLIFLFLGRILWDKGVQELADAAKIVKKRYPAVNFFLLGAIDTKNPMFVPAVKIDEWQREGLVKYLGETDDVRPYITNSDCVLLPSYREGKPRALLEAASMGKPLIATEVAGCRDIIEDGRNGFLVPAKDSRKLAEAIIKIIRLSPAERKRMGEFSRNKILAEFDEEKAIAPYLDVIVQ